MAVEQEAVVSGKIDSGHSSNEENVRSEQGRDVVRSEVEHRGRPRNEDLLARHSFKTMSLIDQIRLESQWIEMLHARADNYKGAHQGFLDLSQQILDHSRHLDELRSKIKPRQPRSVNGINHERIRRAERAEKLNRDRAAVKQGADNGNANG